jgi:hypothetical protein
LIEKEEEEVKFVSFLVHSPTLPKKGRRGRRMEEGSV